MVKCASCSLATEYGDICIACEALDVIENKSIDGTLTETDRSDALVLFASLRARRADMTRWVDLEDAILDAHIHSQRHNVC